MSDVATTYEVGHLYEIDPRALIIGANIRTDTHPDAKEFAASIKTRGVLEVISAYLDPNGSLTVLRGQRRTLVAAKVGTPTGTVPVRVVTAAAEVDRIIDQASENLHRQAMHSRETRDAVEQLALLGISAAQIAKRVALPRATVDHALIVTANSATKERMDATGMTLQEAALFAEFEDDPAAIATLTRAVEDSWRRGQLPHIVQRLRDERAEAHSLQAEVERLRAEGLPVLDPSEVPADLHRHTLTNLRTGDGQPLAEADWAQVAGAALVVTLEWVEPEYDEEADGEEAEETVAQQVYVPVWVCTDPEAAGLHYAYGPRSRPTDDVPSTPENEAEAEAHRQAESAQRRRVIANNKAWKAAEAVRREWLTGLLARRAVPSGAEALIARAVIGCEASLSHVLQHGHGLLPDLLVIKAPETDSQGYGGHRERSTRIIETATTPKAATMRTLAAVLAAWEERSGTHTWRNPTAWDAAVMAALTGWGYPASDVEQLLTPAEDPQT